MTTVQSVTPYPPRRMRPVGPARPVVAVLGAGISGLAAAHRLAAAGYRVELFEKDDHIGGHTASHERDGFVFDEGPHISFTSRPHIQKLLADGIAGEFDQFTAKVSNYWNGHWLRHPAQCYLFGLPSDVVERCLLDLIHERHAPPVQSANYAEWCRRALGQTFCDEFTYRYTRKYWTVDAVHMSTDWIGPRVYQPTLAEVIRGALAVQDANFHYVTQFRYPKIGGFQTYLRTFQPHGVVHLGQPVVSLDMARRELELLDGTRHGFDAVISSLPLPDLVRCMTEPPEAVVESANRLICTGVAIVNVGLARSEGLPDADWIYVYDEDIPFARISFPHRFSPANAPPGCGSIQVETYYSMWRPLPSGDIIDASLSALRRMGIVRGDDRILLADRMDLPYANVLFDSFRAESLATVRAWLAEQNVLCCGRYGRWEYLWTDDSIESGWQAADEVMAAVPVNRWARNGSRIR